MEVIKQLVEKIDDELEDAEKYVNDNFIWSDNMETIAQKLQRINKALNGKLETLLADELAK